MSMELDHSFTVPVPPEQAWDVLLDVERIAPCMPGATVEEFDGEVVTGRIKVKVGPVSLTYRGTAKFTERDPDARVIVLEASGKETRGAGTASATVRATLEPESGGEATKASAATDGGASADQATTTLDGPGSTQPSPVIPSAAPSAATATAPSAPPAQASADSINLVKLMGPALLKRVVPVAVVAAVLALLGRRLFRRGGKD